MQAERRACGQTPWPKGCPHEGGASSEASAPSPFQRKRPSWGIPLFFHGSRVRNEDGEARLPIEVRHQFIHRTVLHARALAVLDAEGQLVLRCAFSAEVALVRGHGHEVVLVLVPFYP